MTLGSLFPCSYFVFVSRQRYQTLLQRIPSRLKALHTEAVAQRALDRRLTEEIHRIKRSIQQLNAYVGLQGHDDLNNSVLGTVIILQNK